MKTKLNNLFNNLSYFDQEGKKIIRRNAQKGSKSWFDINSKPISLKHSVTVSKARLKPETKIKDDSLPIIHFS